MMEILKPYRKKIDDLDDQIVDLLVQRENIIHEVAALKFKHNISAVLQDRVDEVRERNAAHALAKGASEDFMRSLCAKIIAFSCDLEEEMMADMHQKNTKQYNHKKGAL